MTNREAIKLLKTILRTVCLGNQKFIDAVKKAISALKKQEQDRWHSVAKERNPKESNNYLVTLEKGKVMEDFYHVPDNEWSKASILGCGIVAWKPLPDPYTEDEA